MLTLRVNDERYSKYVSCVLNERNICFTGIVGKLTCLVRTPVLRKTKEKVRVKVLDFYGFHHTTYCTHRSINFNIPLLL